MTAAWPLPSACQRGGSVAVGDRFVIAFDVPAFVRDGRRVGKVLVVRRRDADGNVAVDEDGDR